MASGRRSFIKLAALAAASLWGGPVALAEPPRVVRAVVSVPPLKGIVAAALPPGAKVESLIPPGASEHGYEIPPRKLATLATADVVVTVGLGVEPQVDKYLREHPRAGRVEIRFADVAGLAATDHGHDHEHEGHGEACEHTHGVDPHLWLDCEQVTKLAAAVHAKAAEAGMAGDKAALDAFNAKATKVDESYRAMVAQAERRSMVVAHDAWGHLTRRYGLTFVPITGLQAGEATPAAIESAVKAARDLGATAVAVEPQLSQRVARRVAKAANLRVLTLDPLGSGDWFELMERNLTTLREALGVRPAPAAPAEPATKAPSPT